MEYGTGSGVGVGVGVGVGFGVGFCVGTGFGVAVGSGVADGAGAVEAVGADAVPAVCADTVNVIPFFISRLKSETVLRILFMPANTFCASIPPPMIKLALVKTNTPTKIKTNTIAFFNSHTPL